MNDTDQTTNDVGPTKSDTTLVLWDVDLTLVDFSGLGRSWYRIALANVLDIELTHMPALAGRTERAITRDLLAAHGVDGDEAVLRRMFDELVAIADAAREEMRALGRPLPGAHDVLRTMADRSDVVQSLVTGNLPELAGAKLAPFGLDQHLDLDIGGYGSLSERRSDLVASAMERAGAKHGRVFAPASVAVIGDTPADVAAALHHGAIAIGVATGGHHAAELAEAGANHVLDDLSDTPAVISAVLGG